MVSGTWREKSHHVFIEKREFACFYSILQAGNSVLLYYVMSVYQVDWNTACEGAGSSMRSVSLPPWKWHSVCNARNA